MNRTTLRICSLLLTLPGLFLVGCSSSHADEPDPNPSEEPTPEVALTLDADELTFEAVIGADPYQEVKAEGELWSITKLVFDSENVPVSEELLEQFKNTGKMQLEHSWLKIEVADKIIKVYASSNLLDSDMERKHYPGFTLAGCTDTESRSCAIHFADSKGNEKILTVNQKGFDHLVYVPFFLSEDTLEFDKDGGLQTVTITNNTVTVEYAEIYIPHEGSHHVDIPGCFSNDWFKVSMSTGDVRILTQPNDGYERKFSVSVGNSYHMKTIRCVQHGELDEEDEV